MSPQINSSWVIKIASAFCLGYATGRVKRPFLITNISSGIITLCRGQHVACELLFGQTCCTKTPAWCKRKIRSSGSDDAFKILNIFYVFVTCAMWRCCTNSRNDVETVWLRRAERMELPYKYACTVLACLKLYHPEVTKYRCGSVKCMFRQLSLTLGLVLLFFLYK